MSAPITDIVECLDHLDFDYTPPCECRCHELNEEEPPEAVALIIMRTFVVTTQRYVCEDCLEVAQAQWGPSLRIEYLKKT